MLNREDPGAWNLHDTVQGKLLTFGLHELPKNMNGSYLRNGELTIRQENSDEVICPFESVHLRGEHNILNALAACAIAYAAEFSSEAIRKGIEQVKGIPHRLEYIRRWHGAAWYNDSIATTPERTLAAIRAFDGPLVLLLGGRDKKLPWEELAAEVHDRVDHIILFGEAADLIYSVLKTYEQNIFPYSLEKYTSLPEAVQATARIVNEGDIVLLSPGGTSYDAYRDFEERGNLFKNLVETLQ